MGQPNSTPFYPQPDSDAEDASSDQDSSGSSQSSSQHGSPTPSSTMPDGSPPVADTLLQSIVQVLLQHVLNEQANTPPPSDSPFPLSATPSASGRATSTSRGSQRSSRSSNANEPTAQHLTAPLLPMELLNTLLHASAHSQQLLTPPTPGQEPPILAAIRRGLANSARSADSPTSPSPHNPFAMPSRRDPTAQSSNPSVYPTQSGAQHADINDTLLGRLFQTAATVALQHANVPNPTDAQAAQQQNSTNIRQAYDEFITSFMDFRQQAGRAAFANNTESPASSYLRVFRLDGVRPPTAQASDATNRTASSAESAAPSTSAAAATTSAEASAASTNSPTDATPPASEQHVPVVIVSIRNIDQLRNNGDTATTPAENPSTGNATGSTTGSTAPSPVGTAGSEPDVGAPSASRASAPHHPLAGEAQSFIIYIIGSSYPPNHPYILAPNINLSEDATYQELLHLGEMIGPARPVTVSQADIDASGLEVRTLHLSKPTRPMTATSNTAPNDVAMEDVTIASDASPAYSTRARKRGRETDSPVSPPSQKTLTTRLPHGRSKRICHTGLEGLKSSDLCAICLEEWTDQDKIRVLGCQHGFHRNCVDHWLRQGSNHCPVCRTRAVKLPASSPFRRRVGNSSSSSSSNHNASNATSPHPPSST